MDVKELSERERDWVRGEDWRRICIEVWFDKPENRAGKVYFVLAPRYRAIKVGFTSRPVASRIAALQTGIPEPLFLLWEMSGSRELEKALHRRFRWSHIKGEWFRFDRDIASVLFGLGCDRAGWTNPIEPAEEHNFHRPWPEGV